MTAALKHDRVECLVQRHNDGNWESKQCFVGETLSCETRVRNNSTTTVIQEEEFRVLKKTAALIY